MDPDATVAAINYALAHDQYDDAREGINALRAWLEAGGFTPRTAVSTPGTLQALACFDPAPPRNGAWGQSDLEEYFGELDIPQG